MASLGCFIIHGNNATTLQAALSSLRPIATYLVAVDSGSTDSSAELSNSIADRVEQMPWQGYGAARARAAALLAEARVDWGFFLDSDEWMSPDQAALLRERVESLGSTALPHRVIRRNLAYTGGGAPYLFYSDRRVRLFRPGTCPWTRRQIVHESFPPDRHPVLNVVINHRFIDDESERARKQRTYALLWAVQHANSGRRAGLPGAAWLAHFTRDAFVRGAAFRGGMAAIRSAALLATYSHHKRRYLSRCRGGQYGELISAYQSDQLTRLFELAAERVGQELRDEA